MIFCIEYVRADWAHQEVNSGFIYEIASAYPHEKVIVYAVDDQLKGLMGYNYPSNVEFKTTPVCNPYMNTEDNWHTQIKEKVEQLIKAIKVNRGDKIYFLYGDRSLVWAVSKLATKYNKITFFTCIHQQMQYVIGDVADKYTPSWAELEKVYLKNKNSFLIQFNPFVCNRLKKEKRELFTNNLLFLHLSTDDLIKYRPVTQERNNNDKLVRICAYGASASNPRTKEIIFELLKKSESYKIEINVYVRGNEFFEIINDPRVKIIRKFGGYSPEDLLNIIFNTDWIIVPYNKNQYTSHASGILADAIRYSVPVIALDSPYIEYYQNIKKIGVCSDNAENVVSEFYRNISKYNEFIENEKQLHKKLFDENIKTLRMY